MAYIVAQDVVVEVSQSTVTIPIPTPHEANDLILMFIGQDNGTTDITTAASGWNLVSGAQAVAQGQRSVVYWRLATSSAESDVTFSGATAPWIVSAVIVRGADQTNPINANNKTDSANSTSNNLTSGTVTTTVDNCLVFSFIHIDGLFKITPEDPNQVTNVIRQLGGNTCSLLNIFHKLTAGITSTVNYLLETASEGGSCWTVAIADASPSTAGLSPIAPRCYDVIKRYGGISTYSSTDAAFTRHDGITWQTLSSIAATTIDGITVLNNTVTQVNQQSIGQPWGSMTGISVAESAIDATGRWVGATHAISSTDFSDKIIHIEWQQSAVSTAFFGVKGVIMYLEDSSNNWVAHILSIRQGMVANTSYVTLIDTNYTPYASGGTIDLTDITRVAYMYHRTTTAVTTSILRVQNLLLFDTVEVVGGCAGDPITTGKFQNFYTGHGPLYDATVQGNGQALIREGVMIGDGSQKTYVDFSTNSLETPLSFSAALTRRFWKIPVESDSCQFKLKASANDTINYTACVIGTATRQIFQVDPASSASATYNFAGSSIINWLVNNDVFNFNDCTFVRCAFVLNGGGVDNCELVDCEPMFTDDTSNITDSNFTSPGTGHAITITATGTFSLEGNTFSGYGVNATTDAAIYNNSGGAVTLNLLSTDTTPTIRNGAGASTTLVFAPVPVTATILANSRVQLYNVTTATELDNVFVAGTSYSYNIATSEASVGDTVRLRVCKKGYQPFEANAVFALTGVPLVINQAVDAIYSAYALDGATITKFDADYVDDEVDLNVASNFSADEFYAWYNYNLTTEDGIREFYGGVTAVAETDILINTAILDMQFDNLTSTNVFQSDSIRIHRDDEAYPVKNPTTGGGGIDIVWRNQAYLPSITALAPFAVLVAAGVWDRPTTSHTTAGTFGKAVDIVNDGVQKSSLLIPHDTDL
jgi:hypothetical protein